ncbi:odorant receptor 67c-like isoform X3 [Temnothorax americanus]|uniref:odorant receptor 67c-like isoform X3 n=1 Tax=Temnothorax americanus TaxID=1964332 RepID=UPI004067ED7C
MRILNLPFILLTICGCWRPNSWSSLHKRVAYYVYTSITVFIMNTFMLSLLIDITLITDNADDFCDSFFVVIDMLNSCFKVFILLINRKDIIMIIDILMKKPCKPSSSTEINILYKFDKSIELAFIVNERFRLTIAIQFILTTLVACFCLYQISIATTKAKHIEMILYMACILVQNFFYCWYGNELKIKSHQMIDHIFETEWLTLDKNRKKSLMIIMRRTTVPIQITCAYIVPMNLETFMGILKMSYSTYNLLTQNMQV